jgi:hypothetical protein
LLARIKSYPKNTKFFGIQKTNSLIIKIQQHFENIGRKFDASANLALSEQK